nr:hypothetical protein L321_08380 [Pseudomonas plecoglossicida NB2011]
MEVLHFIRPFTVRDKHTLRAALALSSKPPSLPGLVFIQSRIPTPALLFTHERIIIGIRNGRAIGVHLRIG